MSGQHHRTHSTNLHCTARGRPTSSAGCFAARPVPAGSSAAVYYKACAGWIVCRLCLPAHLCHPCLLPSILCLPLFCFAFPRPLFIAMCARIIAQVCRDCSHGSCNTGLYQRPVHRCLFVFIHPSISCVHCVCHLSWHGDCGCAAHAPLCSLRVPLELARRLRCAAHAPFCSLRPC